MKKIVITLIMMSVSYSLFSQGLVITSKFKPITFEEYIAPYASMARAHEAMQVRINDLEKDVVSIMNKDIDDELRRKLQAERKNLLSLSEWLNKYGLSQFVSQEYSSILQRVNKEIENYNSRVEKREKEEIRRKEAERAKQNDAEHKPKEWTGTGFALNSGYVVTNYHVIDGAKSIMVRGLNGDFEKPYIATVKASDKYNDLALLKITDKSFSGFGSIPYKVETNVSDVGEDVFVLGYPLTSSMGDEIKLTTGVVSSKSGYMGDVSLYQISAPIQPGNSGAPLFNSKGNVIGIVNSKHNNAESVGYAIKALYLKNLIDSSISEPLLPKTNTISGLPLTGKVKSSKKYVYIIECSSDNKYSSSATTSSESTYRKNYKIVLYPKVEQKTAVKTTILTVYLKEEYTEIEISYSCVWKGEQWCNINENTYIVVNGKKYKMIKTSGIAIYPDKTYFNDSDDKKFKLYFPPIPLTTTHIDLIEDITDGWKFYGIRLND